MGLKHFILGLILGICLVGCAGFSYRYYGLAAESYDGKLLGPTAKEDLPFSECTPTASDKSPCVVMLQDEFFKMKQDMDEMKAKLKACEQNSAAPASTP